MLERLVIAAVLVLAACRHDPVLNPNKTRARGGPGEVEKVQQTAAAGTVVGRDGSTIELADLWKDRRLVVVFYRGHWCPHCQHQLGELNKHVGELAGMNTGVIGISSDTKEDAEALHAKLALGFEVYSDAGLAVITKWGVEDYVNGISLPATFVVEAGGAISYRHVGEKPSDHPSIDELLAAVKH
jgi:peroxiredoxin